MQSAGDDGGADVGLFFQGELVEGAEDGVFQEADGALALALGLEEVGDEAVGLLGHGGGGVGQDVPGCRIESGMTVGCDTGPVRVDGGMGWGGGNEAVIIG